MYTKISRLWAKMLLEINFEDAIGKNHYRHRPGN